MEKPTVQDVRVTFLNLVLFGVNSIPEFRKKEITSELFSSLLKLDNNGEKEFLIHNTSVDFLIKCNLEERISLIDIINSNEAYNYFLFLVNKTFPKNKLQTKDSINSKIHQELIEYKNNVIVNYTVLYYFKVIIDRLISFDFAVPGVVSKEEYLKISSLLLSNNFNNYFLE